MRLWRTVLPLGLVAVLAGCSVETRDGGLNLLIGSRAAEDFHWRGELPAGRTLEIQDLNGEIHARRSEDGQVEVTARRTARRSDPEEVRIEVVEHAGGVTVCAVYPSDDPAQTGTCTPGQPGERRTRRSDVKVSFTVAIPPGVSFVARTVNGSVVTERLDSDVTAHAVNGSLRLDTERHVSARTVNGSIRASMGRPATGSALEFRTVNGSINLELPRDVGVELSAETTNGSISSEFELTEVREQTRRRLAGRIGTGGPELSLRSVNGSIRVRQAS